MDIWAWVNDKEEELRNAGHHRLADIMDELPGLVVDNEIELIESIVPEGLALARALGEKWVELFIRHWNLQSLVLTRMEVKDALPEATSLLEFAHQEDTKDCPQSVCVVQDLACCYAHQDGPGYAEQRKAVALEAFQRIDPTWSCFTCIAEEYSDALLDQQQYQEVIKFTEDCDQKLLKAGLARETGYLLIDRIKAYLALRQLDDAERACKYLDNPYGGESFELSKKIIKALVHAHKGNIEGAQELLPNSIDKNQQSDFLNWAQAHLVLSEKTAQDNTLQLAIQINKMILQLLHQGVYRDSLELSYIACRLAIARGQYTTAQVLLNACPEIIKNLKSVLDAQDKLDDLKKLLGQHEVATPTLPNDAVEFLNNFDEQDKFKEESLPLLTFAHKQWPENQDIIILLASNLENLGFAHQAQELLSDHLGHNPDSARVINAYGGFLIEEKPNKFIEFVQQHGKKTQDRECLQNIEWLKARYFRKIGKLHIAKTCLEDLLISDPHLFNTRLFLTAVLRDLEEYEEALKHIEVLLQNEGEDELHWDRMVLATFLQDWDKVRESSAVAGVNIEGTGPINENWGSCRIQIIENSEKQNFYATRTGPATARIVGISHIEEIQHYQDEVIFDPYPLNELNIEDEEGDMVDEEGYDTYIYPCLKITKQAQYQTFDIDGVHPGNEKVQELKALLEEIGVTMSFRSTDDYELYHLEEDKTYPGIYAYILLKPDADLALINQKLKTFCSSLDHPLIWIKLLRQIDDAKALEEQYRVKDLYDM